VSKSSTSILCSSAWWHGVPCCPVTKGLSYLEIWKKYNTSNHYLPSTKIHGVIAQKTNCESFSRKNSNFIYAAVFLITKPRYIITYPFFRSCSTSVAVRYMNMRYASITNSCGVDVVSNMLQSQNAGRNIRLMYANTVLTWEASGICVTTFQFRARGGVVVKALRYKPAGRGFDSQWCHWNFSVTCSLALGSTQSFRMSKPSWMMNPTRSREIPSRSTIDLDEIRRSSKISSWIWSIISGVATVLCRPERGASQVEKITTFKLGHTVFDGGIRWWMFP